MTSRRSWRSACNLNESSQGDQKWYNPENSNKKSNELLSEQRKNSHQQSCNFREKDHLKYRKRAKFCLSHMHINLILSSLWQSSFVVADSPTPEQLSSVYEEMTQKSQVQLERGTSSVITSSTACVPFHRDIGIQRRYQNGNLKRTESSCTEPFCTRYK